MDCSSIGKSLKNYNSHNNEHCVHGVVCLSLFRRLTLTVIINTLVSLSAFVFHYFLYVLS